MSVKKIWLYDSQQSFGNGAEINRSTDSSSPETADKVRWQDEKLWPAFYESRIVDEGAGPRFVDAQDVGHARNARRITPSWLTKNSAQGAPAPFQYADARKVHKIEHARALLGFQDDSRFGRYIERFDLYIDAGRFIDHYGDKYNITRNSFGNLFDSEDAAPPPRDILDANFATAMRELYGLYIPFDVLEPAPRPFGAGIEEWQVPWSVSAATSKVVLEMKPFVSYDLAEWPPVGPAPPVADLPEVIPNEDSAQERYRRWRWWWNEKIGNLVREGQGHHPDGTRREQPRYRPTDGPPYTIPPPPDIDVPPPPALGGHVYVTNHPPQGDDFHPQNFFSTREMRVVDFINRDAPAGEDVDDFDYVAKVFLFRVPTDANWIRGVMRVWAHGANDIPGFTDGYREFDLGFETQITNFQEGVIQEYRDITIEQEDLRNLAQEFQFERPDNQLPGLSPRPGTLFGVAISEFLPKDPPPVFRRSLPHAFLEGFNKTYVDHFTSINQALPAASHPLPAETLNPTVAIESKYNFELRDYEKALHEVIKPYANTAMIPNIYLLEDYTATELFGEIPNDQDEEAARTRWRRARDFVNVGGLIQRATRREREYFCAWTHEAVKVLPFAHMATDRNIGGYVQAFEDPYKAIRNIFIPPEEKNFLNDAKINRNEYPMYNTIMFAAAQEETEWGTRFRDNRLSKFFARALDLRNKAQFNTFSIENFGQNAGKLFNTNTVLNSQEFPIIDILEYLKAFQDPDNRRAVAAALQQQSDNPLTIIGNSNSDHIRHDEFDIEEPELLTQAPHLARYIRRIVRNDLRSYEQLLSGEEAPSQTVFYRIEKRLNDQIVQSIFVPNTDEFFDNPGFFEYIDTQIVNFELGHDPGVDTYNYNIYAVRMIVGNKYRRNITTSDFAAAAGWNYAPGAQELETIEEPNLQNINNLDIEARWFDDGPKIRIGVLVDNTPSVKMVEVPIFKSDDSIVIDKPPLPPNIEFYSYKSVNNEIGIRMSMLVGTDVGMKPIPLSAADAALFVAILSEQRRNGTTTGDKIIFGNDDTPSQFEAYRLETAPKSYQDFQNQPRHYTAFLRGNDAPKADTDFFVDSIIPNKKYYYVFRTLDSHGLISNPSSIYEVELVENAGATYLLTSIYKFPEEKPIYTKDLQQYLKIKPSIIQSALNERESGLVGDDDELTETAFDKTITLGPGAHSVWNKELKFRITSKKTGRKIDINLDFKTKQDTARDELDKDALGCPPAPPQPPAQPPDDRRDEIGDFLVGDAEAVGDDIQVGIGVDPSGEIA